MQPASYWIEKLGLKPHRLGGYLRETYRSARSISRQHLPGRFGGERAMSTAIYYLLTPGAFSSFYRIPSDEIWHYYAGAPVLIHVLNPTSGSYNALHLGPAPEKGHRFQVVIPANTWFAAVLETDETEYALCGCTVAPGFDYTDFELAEPQALTERFPEHARLIASIAAAKNAQPVA